MIVADTTAAFAARTAIFGFGMFLALSLIDRLPSRRPPPGPYTRGKTRATKILIPVFLVLGVVGSVVWLVAR